MENEEPIKEVDDANQAAVEEAKRDEENDKLDEESRQDEIQEDTTSMEEKLEELDAVVGVGDEKEEFDEEVEQSGHVEDRMVDNKTFLPDYGIHPFWVKDKRNQFQKWTTNI